MICWDLKDNNPNKKAYCLLRAFFVQLRAKCWALRAKYRANQRHKLEHRANSCKILDTSCQMICQPNAQTWTSCQFVQNIGHFLPKIRTPIGTNSNIVPIRAKHWTLHAIWSLCQFHSRNGKTLLVRAKFKQIIKVRAKIVLHKQSGFFKTTSYQLHNIVPTTHQLPVVIVK